MKTKLKTYKGVDIFYNHGNGKIEFEFEGRALTTKYVFEAEEVIDEPVWEICDLQGYFIDGTFGDYIGKAIAKKKNIKSGEPLWKVKGRYDSEYKQPNYGSRVDVYLRSELTDKIYKEWEVQEENVKTEEIKRMNIIAKLKIKQTI